MRIGNEDEGEVKKVIDFLVGRYGDRGGERRREEEE